MVCVRQLRTRLLRRGAKQHDGNLSINLFEELGSQGDRLRLRMTKRACLLMYNWQSQHPFAVKPAGFLLPQNKKKMLAVSDMESCKRQHTYDMPYVTAK